MALNPQLPLIIGSDGRQRRMKTGEDVIPETLLELPTMVSELNELDDVTITSPSNAQTLRLSGSQWVNSLVKDVLYDTGTTLDDLVNTIFANMGTEFNARSLADAALSARLDVLEAAYNWGSWQHTNATAYTADTFTAIPFASAITANTNIHSTSVNNTQFTIPATGLWSIAAKFYLNPPSFGARQANIGATLNNASPTNADTDFVLRTAIVDSARQFAHLFINDYLYLTSGDVVRFFIAPVTNNHSLGAVSRLTTCTFVKLK